MRLEAFHLLATLHHIYAIVHLLSVNYVGATDAFVLVMRDMGFRYLTGWNLVSEMLYITVWNLPMTCTTLVRNMFSQLLTFWTLSVFLLLFKNNVSTTLPSPLSGKSLISWTQLIELVIFSGRVLTFV
jgi:hypothetical protein